MRIQTSDAVRFGAALLLAVLLLLSGCGQDAQWRSAPVRRTKPGPGGGSPLTLSI